jgi:integrase/recombinase XerD
LAGAGPITSAWHIKHSALRGFYIYAVSRGHVAASPVTTVIPKRPPNFVPYIYSHDELRRLLLATDVYQRNRSCVEPTTVRTMILLLYGAGLRLREAVALAPSDVDLEDRLLTIRQTKFYKSRFVPVGPQLCEALARYGRRPRSQLPSAGDAEAFFTTRAGTPMNRYTVEGIFQRLRERAGIRRFDGARYQPRLHDLRHNAESRIMPSWSCCHRNLSVDLVRNSLHDSA